MKTELKDYSEENVTCECGQVHPLDFTTISDDGYSCPKCQIEYLNELINKPPTAQQATSKSLDECLDEACKEAGLENGWKDVEWFAGLNEVDKEHLSDIINNTIKKYAQYQQPHPQDSSSGEVEGGSLPCDICGDAVCQCNNTPPASESPCEKCKGEDGNGLEGFTCTKCGRAFKNNHEVSESLEQAAKFDLVAEDEDGYSHSVKIHINGRSYYIGFGDQYDEARECLKILESTFTQQQKPLVVFPDETWINNKVDDYFKVKDPYNESVFKNGMIEMLTEIRTRLSAANGVDPIELLKWSLRLTTEERFIHKPHDPRYNDDILRIYNKYLEQSQQRHKIVMATKEEILKKHSHYPSHTVKAAMQEYTDQETKELKDELKETEADLIEAYRLGNLMEQQLTEANALIEKMGKALEDFFNSDGNDISTQKERHETLFNQYKTTQEVKP